MELFRLLGRRRAVCSTGDQRNSNRAACRPVLILIAAIGAAALTGCRHQEDSGPQAQIRFVDAVPDADAVWLSVQSQTIFGNRIYGSASDYVGVPAGSFTIGAMADRADQTEVSLPAVPETLQPNRDYLGIALGSASNWPHAHVQLFPDDPDEQCPVDHAAVRVINAYPHDAKINVIFNNIVAFGNIPFGAASPAITFPARTYIGKTIVDSDYDQPLVGPTQLDLEGGKSYDLIVLGESGQNQPQMLLIRDEDPD